MMVVKMEQGWDRVRAASFAWESTAFPMLTGTLVTAAGFLPIGFANSSVGEYAGGIFWVVAIALLASWIVAVVFTPYIGVKLLPNFKKLAPGHDPHEIYETRMYRALRRVIEWCVRRRVTVVVATAGIFVLSILAFGHVQQQFFPLSERPELFFQLRLPAGTAFGTTLESVKRAQATLKNDNDIATYTAYVGRGSPRFWLGLNPQLPDEAFAEIVILSKDVEARERIKARLEKAVADGALSEARVRVDRFNFGPPVGFPVQFRVIGPDAKKVRDIAYQVREVMRADDKVIDPHPDWNEQAPYLKLAIDQDRVRAMGLTPQDIAQALSMLISGVPITTVRDGIEKSPRSGSISRISTICRFIHATASRFRCRRSPMSNTATRSRSCGGSIATCRSRCAPTSLTAFSRQTRPTRSGRSFSRSAIALSRPTGSRSAAPSRNRRKAMRRSSCSSR
jgi:multidrug efflux pump